MKIQFVGLSGYSYPYVRVRCYGFARELRKYGPDAQVLSFRDHLSGGLSEIEMWSRGDREKLVMNARALLRLVQERPQLYYIQKIHYHAAAPYLLARLTGIPYILDYDDWDEGIECLFKRPSINRFAFGAARYADILKRVAGGARACVVSSHYLEKRLADYTERICRIPTGVDTTRFSPSPTPRQGGRVVFGWTGVVWGGVMVENIRFMLECFSRVAERVPCVALSIVGGGERMPEVREIIARDYGGLAIELREWVPHGLMPVFLSRIDVGLLPLIQEGNPWICAKSPTKLFEYMAKGIPVVASRVGEMQHIIDDGHNGFLADTRDDWIEKMTTLARDPELRTRLGSEAREKAVREYSMEVLGNKLWEFIQVVL